ncbi:4'-phosphopantetheinyl transferase superfamily protein [Flavobacterium sp.]|uniref:4'-phosphopantetheinyl transferase family protein n=1 Tax=Flavobacterium sp. TaxID=239 RepID=UPI00260E48A7|nr:4'-phosphopantetheinyl transferase superfamily protein [Flavobacterium sp.]
MIGNDVVDLGLASTQSNWKRKGYLSKIFTDLEQEFISKSSNPNEMVWNLWSRKEAVYKIILQQNGKRGYYPKKIECLNTDNDNGIVVYQNDAFFTTTETSQEFIHSIAVLSKEKFSKIIEITDAKKLVKINEIPYFKLNSKFYAATKSHHGAFEKSYFLQS